MPLPGRGLTSMLLRREGDLFLFDCGEATQIAFRRLNLKWKKISAIFVSHTHADHVTGLPGLLSLSAQVDRTEPLHIFGPPRIKSYVEESLRILDLYINYEIVIHQGMHEGEIYSGDGYRVEAMRLSHSKPCLGYCLIEEDRPGVFFPDRATALEVPRGPMWAKLQGGESVELEGGRRVAPAEVMGDARPGRKVGYVTDTLLCNGITEFVDGADLLICEGMFTEDLADSAREKRHMTARQAAGVARDAQVRRMGLIHYSPRYTERDLKRLLKEARSVFPDAFLTRDLQELSVPYRDAVDDEPKAPPSGGRKKADTPASRKERGAVNTQPPVKPSR